MSQVSEYIYEQLKNKNGNGAESIWSNLVVYVAVYAKGDGSDEAVKLQTALTNAENKLLIFEAGKTYKSTSKLTIPQGCTIFGNGATVNFHLSGNSEGFVFSDNVSMYNLKVNALEVTAATGPGQYGAAVVIGNYGTGAGNKNIVIENCTLSAQRNDGNVMLITGDSSNIRLTNLIFPDNAKSSGGILAHWGGADNPTAGTFHPHDIVIQNIKFGKFTVPSPDLAPVSLSGVYNVTVENVTIEETARQAVSVFVGDYGFDYADTLTKNIGPKGIEISNLSCKKSTKFAASIDNKTLGGTIYPSEIILRNCTFEGTGDASVNNGILIQNVNGLSVEDCSVSGFLNGLVIGTATKNITIEGGRYNDNREIGISISGAVQPTDILITDTLIDRNAQYASGSYRAGIYINGTRVTVTNCNIGETGEPYQFYGITVDTSLDTVIQNCHVLGVKAGGIGYQLGTGSSHGFVKSFLNNTVVTGITFKGGLLQVPLYVTVDENGNTVKTMIGGSAPTSGTWTRGDRVINNFPSTAGTAGSQYIVQGWIYNSVAWIEQRTLTGT